MAESILSGLAGNIIAKLGSLALGELTLLCGIPDELEKLKNTLFAIKAVLLDAEEQQSKSHEVKSWVLRLKDALYDIDDLIDEFSYETLRRQVKAKSGRKSEQVRMFFSKSNLVAFGFIMGHKIKAIREKLNDIDADKTKFSFPGRIMDMRDDGLRKERETYSFIPEGEMIGRGDDQKKIVDLLLNTNFKENIAVIAIVGMGGLGKTSLAQSVYTNEMVMNHFELKLWVCISDEFDVKIIAKKILKAATMKECVHSELEVVQSLLRKEIDGKKYLLIMDDVWEENYEKWDKLKRLLIGGATGSRILITTRSNQVAKTFDVLSLYPLNELNKDDSWLLFKKMASLEGAEEEFENANLVKIGKEIVAKLKGVPLTIRTIGRLLCSKKSEADWLSFKDHELSRPIQQNDEIQSILKISYNHLSYNLKQCFAYCALFPKDYEIQKDEVIKLWAAQGFVQPHGTKAIEDIGDDYFMELLWKSFFQDIRNDEFGDIKQFKMHDLMHDLAYSVGEKECVAIGSVDAESSIEKGIRHVFFEASQQEFDQLPKFLIKAKNLRTLYHPPILEQKTVHKTFSNHLRLRTLVLIYYIDKLPKPTSQLKHLRYLNLTGNCNIQFLPNSITELYNLETLILYRCTNLRALPRDTKNLIRLTHLDMRNCCQLTHMPKGLGEMTSLRTMNLFVLGNNNGSGLSELNGLQILKGSLTIRELQFQTIVDLQKGAFYLKRKSGIKQLELCWNDRSRRKSKIVVAFDDEERVLERLEPHPNLQKLKILGYQGVRLCNWLSCNYLARLVTIKLSSCRRLQCLPQFDQFPLLKHLCLESLDSIEYIDNNSHLSSSTFFPSLDKLQILHMPDLKGWWKGETSRELSQNSDSFPTTMPCLSMLVIKRCGQLTLIPCHVPLQSVEINSVKLQLFHSLIKTRTKIAIESSSTPSKLSSLCLEDVEDLEFLPEELFCNSLKVLRIINCVHLRMLSPPTTQPPIEEDDDSVLWKKLKSLHSLYLSVLPKLEHLPKGLRHVTTLQSLIITQCPSSLLEGISHLGSLSSLEIYGCPNFTSLPEGISHLVSLSHLKIYNSPNFTSLSEGICHLVSLSSLEIEECPNFTSLPEGICQLISLKELKIRFCPKFTLLPEGIGHLVSLLDLDLHNCPNLTSLPAGICHLVSLLYLDIGFTNLNSLPEGIRHLHSLQHVNINGCPEKLIERCLKGKGEDWPKIQHVPNLRF